MNMKPSKTLLLIIILVLILLVAGGNHTARASEVSMSETSPRAAPEDFTRFHFSGHDREAKILNNYLWYHLDSRIYNLQCLFYKEYLTISDLWLAQAADRQQNVSIQESHRRDLLSTALDREGYVHMHQHFSHAHDHGWPFPVWTQSGITPDQVDGLTAGWHFQDKNDIAGLIGVLFLWNWDKPQYYGETSLKGWDLENVESLGIVDKKWQLRSTGESPAITTPAGIEVEAYQSPFLQIRWTRTGEPPKDILPYIEWLREGDKSFGPDRRVRFDYESTNRSHYPAPGEAADRSILPQEISGTKHCLIDMHRHPKWRGKIKRMRICLAPGESDVEFSIDSFFTVYDTRITTTNPIFVFSCWNYFRWTGNVDFLRANIDRMRIALRYQQNEMGGLKFNHIRNTWQGHDGTAGWKTNPDGSKTIHGGHGMGSNYWDALPFGWDDMYATSQYYAANMTMAEIEEAILSHPKWGIARSILAFDPAKLREHAQAVKNEANRKFWDAKTGRFIGCVDINGVPRDYGFVIMNLETIWYGIATDEHARSILDWVTGKRIVEGDTSTGADIYRWRFGPRSTTKRNIEWCMQGWYYPESIPWGGQVQDGGAVLGFSFFDLWARLRVLGPDDAWQRLSEIMDWEEEVWAEGGYRAYYKNGKRGTTLQGGGPPGGLGIDVEFLESSLIPSIVTYGFLGLDPRDDVLIIHPKLPRQCPEMGISNLLYHNTRLDIRVAQDLIEIELKETPQTPVRLRLDGEWKLKHTRTGVHGSQFDLTSRGMYTFLK